MLPGRIRRLNWGLNEMKFAAVACIIYLLLSRPDSGQRLEGLAHNLSSHKTNSFRVMRRIRKHLWASLRFAELYILVQNLWTLSKQREPIVKRPASGRGEVDDIADRISYLNITNPLRLRTDRQAKFNLLLSRLKEVSTDRVFTEYYSVCYPGPG